MGRPPYAEKRSAFLLRPVETRHKWFVATAKKMGLSTNEFYNRVLTQFHSRAENLEIKQLKEAFKQHGEQGK